MEGPFTGRENTKEDQDKHDIDKFGFGHLDSERSKKNYDMYLALLALNLRGQVPSGEICK